MQKGRGQQGGGLEAKAAAAGGAKPKLKSAASSRQAQQFLHHQQQLQHGSIDPVSSSSFSSPSFASFALPSSSFLLHLGDTPGDDGRQQPQPLSLASASPVSPSAPPGLVGGRGGVAEVDCPEPAVALLLKRLQKRDAVTKVKALEALSVAVSELSAAALLSVLPAYFASFQRTWKDNDRRVREGLYPSLLLVMKAAGKATTPWLRALLPLWWLHCHDPEREVSRAAWRTLRAVWPEEERRRQLLTFVHDDIFEYSLACLTCSVQGLSDMQVTSAEEAQERFDRVVSAALLGLASFMEALQPAGGGQHGAGDANSGSVAATPSPSPYGSSYSRLLDAAVRHLSSPRPLLRRSTYSLLTRAVRVQPSFFAERLPSLSSLLFGVVAEVDGGCQAAMWDLLLSFLTAFPSAVAQLPPEPQRFRPLLRSIERGGYGHPSHLYSQMLPLLASLPPSSTSASFFSSFFHALHASAAVKEERAGGSVSAAGGEADMASAYVECALYTVVSARKERPSISLAVLVDILLPFVQQACSAYADAAVTGGVAQQAADAELCRQAGRALAIVERHIAAGPAETTQRLDDSERAAASELFDLPAFHFRLQEVCITALEQAERAVRARTLDGAEALDEGLYTSKGGEGGGGAGGGGGGQLQQTGGWAKVEQLLRAMSEERRTDRKAAQPAQPRVQQGDEEEVRRTPSSGEATAPSLLSMVATVFRHSLAVPPALPPLRLALFLARAFSLTALLAHSHPLISPERFLSQSLLPLFHSVFQSSAGARQLAAAAAAQSELVEAAIDLLALGLSAAGLTCEQLSEQQRRVLEELLRCCCLHSQQPPSPVTAAGLRALQAFLSRLASSSGHLRGHPLLEEEALHLAEALLTLPSPALHPLFISLFATLLPLLPHATRHAILSSFTDALSSFLALSGLFAPSSVSEAQLREDSGATAACLPVLLDILAPFVAAPRQLSSTVSASFSSSSAHTPGESPLLASALFVLFFLQSSAVTGLSSRARSCWRSLPESVWSTAKSALCDIAERFHAALLATPLPSMTSEWILSWADSAHSLLQLSPASPSSPSSSALWQRLLAVMLLREGEVAALMADAEADAEKDGQERLRVVRDCVFELMSSEQGWDAELLTARPSLLLELLAIQQSLRRSSTQSELSSAGGGEDVDGGSDVERELRLRLTSLITTQLSPSSLSDLLAVSVRASCTLGGVWSEALQQLLELSSQLPSLASSSSPVVLFVRCALLPLAQLAPSPSFPSSFSSLLAPLTSSLQRTLTRPMRDTLLAFTSIAATFSATSGLSAAQPQQAQLSPPLDVLLRALLTEAERMAAVVANTAGTERPQLVQMDAAAVLYLSSLLCCLSSVVLRAPSAPGWSGERCRSLLRALPPPPPPQSEAGPAFHEGRALLVLAVWSSQQQRQATPDASSYLSVVRLLLACATSTLSFAVALDDGQGQRVLARLSRSSSSSFVQPVLEFLHSALPVLLSSSSSVTLSDLRPLATSAYELLTSPFVSLLSVSRREAELSSLADAVERLERSHSSDKADSLLLTRLADDLQHAAATASASSSPFPASASPLSSAASSSPSARLCRLFGLLAHPFPAVSLCVHGLLSLALLRRASLTAAAVEASEESLATLQRQLSLDDGEDEDVSEAAEEEGGGRKEGRRRRRRLQREKQHMRQRLALLLPPQLQALLDARLATSDAPSLLPEPQANPSEASASALFAGRSLAHQLRGYLLTLSLVLSLLHQPPASSSGAQQSQESPSRAEPASPSAATGGLSDAQRGVIIAYLRDEDIAGPYLDELSEHLLLALPRAAVDEERRWQVELLSHGWALTEVEELLPVRAREEAEAQLTAATGLRRVAQLQRLRSLLSYVDDAVYFPSLCARLYLLVLQQLPALARSWWTNVERQWSPLISVLTAARFSPSLIRYQLEQLAQQPALQPAVAAAAQEASSASTLTISANPALQLASARYRCGEVEMTLLLRMAASHPLQAVSVEWTDSVRVQAAWLMRWQVAIASALHSANGGLHSAIRLFFHNVEQHFAGVGECAICYAVLHPVHHTLPRMRCRTCQHLFHATCLYTWFEKSGHSTCPLCRATF